MEGEAIEIQAEGNHMELENKKGETVSAKGNSAGDSKSRKKRKQREFYPPALDRPARERKSIERLVISPDKEIKEFKILKGAGTAFKDIPNIVFKLSKRRASDEVVQSLHKVLFGKTVKHFAKTNILQFSGYVWSGNEEKEKAKIKERLERCIKESLFQISDILDLNLSKSTKKEDGVLKVLEFLESPHKTSDELFEENAKVKKSKKAKKTPVKGSKKKASGKTPGKSPKGAKKTTRKKQTSDEEDGSDAADFEKDVEEELEEEKSDDDYADKSTSSKKRRREPTKKQESRDEEETLPKKKKSIKEVKKEKKKPIKEAIKERKPRAKAEKSKEPSEEDLQAAICELLQNADFSKVTLTDVMKQLSEKFKVDLTHRKSHLKALIREEIAKLVGEGDNEDDDGNEEGENDDEEKVDGEQEEEEDISGDDRTRDDEHEDQDGDDKAGDGNGDDEDGDGEKAEGEDEDEDANRVENKADGGDEDEDGKVEHDGDAEAEEDSTDMA